MSNRGALFERRCLSEKQGRCATRPSAVLILGGGVGNIIDRIANGYVVDMFDLLLFDYPVFNLADCFVVVGVILGAVYYLWFYEKYDARKKDDATDADGDK